MSRASEAAARLIALPEGQVPVNPPTGTHRRIGPRVTVKIGFGDLTPREYEILRLLATGLSNTEIGRELFIAEQTVKFHLTNIYRTLGARNRTEAAFMVYNAGLLNQPSATNVEAVIIGGQRYEVVEG